MPISERLKSDTHVICGQCGHFILISDSRSFEDMEEDSISLRCFCGHYGRYVEAHLISGKRKALIES